MSLDKEIEYVFSLRRLGMKLGLKPIKEVIDKLGNPHKSYKIVHVAGTNGKGSTCAMISNILSCAGYKVGMFTSPHLVNFNERFQINGTPMSNLELSDLISRIRKKDVHLTFFEFSTAMALQYFKDQHVDFAVVEVGMGGTYDSTNVVNADIAAITSIGLDHTEFLGNTIEKITGEKCGIIKPNSQVVTNYENKGLQWIRKKASDLTVVNPYQGEIGLQGTFQKLNAAIAAEVCRKLNIPGEKIREGIKTTEWPGRLEYIENNVLLDCAHNPDGIEEVTKFVKGLNYKRLVIVFGVTSKKDHKTMLKSLPRPDFLILTKPNIHKSLDPVGLVHDGPCAVIEDPEEAIRFAKNIANKEDLVLVTGSCYLIGNIKSLVHGKLTA